MAERGEPKRSRPEFSDEELKIIGQNIDLLQPYISSDRILRSFLAIALVLGLVAHVAGYLIKVGAADEPWRLVGDLIYALGFALWTGTVVVFFVQVFPEAKRRQLERAIAAVEALKRSGRG